MPCKFLVEFLSVLISTVTSKLAFSAGGRVLDQFRSSLTPKLVESLTCAQNWLRVSPLSIEIAMYLEEIEKNECDIYLFNFSLN